MTLDELVKIYRAGFWGGEGKQEGESAMSPENKIQDKYDQMAGVSECPKCKGSGELAISVTTGRYMYPGPVPEDARCIAAATCYVCKGCGYVDGDE